MKIESESECTDYVSRNSSRVGFENGEEEWKNEVLP